MESGEKSALLKVGILRETKPGERRTPLVPDDVRWLRERGVDVLAESSGVRVFGDDAMAAAGARIVPRAEEADLLFGIKEPRVEDLLPGKTYAVFSHTIKGQPASMPLLAGLLERGASLLDWECIVDRHDRRLVYFGRFAGICGMVDSLHYLGAKLAARGHETPLQMVGPAKGYPSLPAIRADVQAVAEAVEREGVPEPMAPFVIGITGHGNVSQGAQEVLDWLDPIEVHPRDIGEFVRHERARVNRTYKIVLLREEKLRARDGKGFYFEEYLEEPHRFESNLDVYLPHLTMLVHTSYWDARYPRLVTREMLRGLVGETGRLRLEFIGDLSCDLQGAIEVTERITTVERPTFTYDPRGDTFHDGHHEDGVAIMAVDNLPSELPLDASVDFSGQVREYVYQLAAHGCERGAEQLALPAELRRAFVAHRGRLTERFEGLAAALFAR